MERRNFLRRGAAIALGAGLASGVASGVADLTTPAARARERGAHDRLEVLEGEVTNTFRQGRIGGLRWEGLRITLETNSGSKEVIFYDADNEFYAGPRFDLDVLEDQLEPHRRVRIVAWQRESGAAYDGLKVLS